MKRLTPLEGLARTLLKSDLAEQSHFMPGTAETIS